MKKQINTYQFNHTQTHTYTGKNDVNKHVAYGWGYLFFKYF